MRWEQEEWFSCHHKLQKGCVDPGAAHHLQHPALGGFGPLTQNLLSPRTLLYIWRYAPCVWTYHLIVIEILHKKSSVCLLKNISIQSGIMALFFFKNHTPFTLSRWWISHIGTIWDTFSFFPSQRINIKKWSISFQMYFFLPFIMIFFKFMEAINKHQRDSTTSVAL